MPELLTMKQAHEFSGLSISRLRQLVPATIKAVKTPTTSIYRGEWRIDKNSLIDYLAKRRPAGRPKK